MIKIHHIVAISLSFFAVKGASASDNLIEIPVNDTAKIEKHGICRMVYNDGGSSIMVPTRVAEEWAVGANAFLKNIAGMDDVTVHSCETILPVFLVDEVCYPGHGRNPAVECLRPDGPRKGEQVRLGSAVLFWISQTPRCVFWNQGSSNQRIHIATYDDIHGTANERIPFDLATKIVSNQFPVDSLEMPSGSNECVLNIQYNDNEATGGTFFSYRFRR
ncbi:hypothetical protein KUV57_11760 [Epibacterium sp. DP7N7-1]|nr:hypothetical protein [Epibacterium sp. DP7N7-1]